MMCDVRCNSKCNYAYQSLPYIENAFMSPFAALCRSCHPAPWLPLGFMVASHIQLLCSCGLWLNNVISMNHFVDGCESDACNWYWVGQHGNATWNGVVRMFMLCAYSTQSVRLWHWQFQSSVKMWCLCWRMDAMLGNAELWFSALLGNVQFSRHINFNSVHKQVQHPWCHGRWCITQSSMHASSHLSYTARKRLLDIDDSRKLFTQ